VFEIYTEKARVTIFFAMEEAQKARSEAINAEHLLLGLLRSDPAFLGTLLPNGASEESFRARIARQMPEQPGLPANTELPLSKDSKRALAYAAEEAQSLGHRHIGTEHLLIGILREQGCIAEQFLAECGADAKAIRRTLATGSPTEPEPPGLIRGAFAHYLDEAREKLASLGYPASGPGRLSKAGMDFHRFTERARRVIFFARYEANDYGSPEIDPEHVLLGIVREMSPDFDGLPPYLEVLEALRNELPKGPPTRTDTPLSARTKQLFVSALEEAEQLQAPHAGPEHMLLAICESHPAMPRRSCGSTASIRIKSVERSITPEMTPCPRIPHKPRRQNEHPEGCSHGFLFSVP
jgi:ATP-dependent Clp protease ATP-binding subunit ClpA